MKTASLSNTKSESPEVHALKPSRRVLEPSERIAEVLFGLIMVLTFTGSLSVADAGRDDVRAMLIGALGCNLAWGLIDGVLYLMGSLAEKNKSHATLRGIHKASAPSVAYQVIADAIPAALAHVLDKSDLEMLRKKLNQVPLPTSPPRLTGEEWKGALAVFFLVFTSTFPVAVPFMFIHNAETAMRVSNGIAVTMLFFTGFAYGRCVGRSSWLVGLAMVGLGAVLVAITMALGG